MLQNVSSTKKDQILRTYNSRLQKGGALLEDMRLLVRSWEDRGEQRVDDLVAVNVLGKNTRARTMDTFRRAFLPRFVNGRPPQAWKIPRKLEDRNAPFEILRPVYYWLTARNEPILYDFVTDHLMAQSRKPSHYVTTADVADWITNQLAGTGKSWSESVTLKVARGMLAALRDFGVLEGAIKKKIAPMYIPIESFAYMAFALNQEGVVGTRLLDHPDWALFLATTPFIERMFIEADRNRFVSYQSAGKLVRIDFAASNFGEMADVVTARAH